MFAGSLRFLHASDFHLNRPMAGLAGVPGHLREAIVDAPIQAAGRLFEAAVAEGVDFVVLSGNIIDPAHAGPRCLNAFREQLRALTERGIPVYWAGGTIDAPERWPEALPMPEGITVFGKGAPEQIIHGRDGQTPATIVGQSRTKSRIRAADFDVEGTDVFSVAVACGDAKLDSLKRPNVHYWALGGREQPETLRAPRHVAHYAGTHQGRGPGDIGPHGATLVTVDASGTIRTQAVPTDTVRWHHEQVEMADGATGEQLWRPLADRMKELVEASVDRTLLVCWTVRTAGRLGYQLRRQGLDRELLERLRREFGRGEPAVWTVRLDAAAAEPVDRAYLNEDTILGDFLRAVDRCRENTEEPLELESYLTDRQMAGTYAGTVAFSSVQERSAVLQDAADLGFDLLHGEQGGASSARKLPPLDA